MRVAVLLIMVGLLAGCAKMPWFTGPPADATGPVETAMPDETPAPETDVPGNDAPTPPPAARTVEQFDTTTAEDRQQAVAEAEPVAAETRLGTTIASLGDPASPGFWAETPLVDTVQEGRLEYPTSGKSVKVELRPSGGAPGSGTRVSLPALRLLGAPLTALPQLVVFGQ